MNVFVGVGSREDSSSDILQTDGSGRTDAYGESVRGCRSGNYDGHYDNHATCLDYSYQLLFTHAIVRPERKLSAQFFTISL